MNSFSEHSCFGKPVRLRLNEIVRLHQSVRHGPKPAGQHNTAPVYCQPGRNTRSDHLRNERSITVFFKISLPAPRSGNSRERSRERAMKAASY